MSRGFEQGDLHEGWQWSHSWLSLSLISHYVSYHIFSHSFRILVVDKSPWFRIHNTAGKKPTNIQCTLGGVGFSCNLEHFLSPSITTNFFHERVLCSLETINSLLATKRNVFIVMSKVNMNVLAVNMIAVRNCNFYIVRKTSALYIAIS